MTRSQILDSVDPEKFRDFWDVGGVFVAYLRTYDIALAISLVLWTISIEEFDTWTSQNN